LPAPTPFLLPPPFDLGTHGIEFTARAVVPDGDKLYLLVYVAKLHAAALVDVRTGLAQIARPFAAEVPDTDPRGLITFDDVTVLARRTFIWWHRGAAWSHNWDETLPWEPMPLWRWR
jgi:hypothetical protein